MLIDNIEYIKLFLLTFFSFIVFTIGSFAYSSENHKKIKAQLLEKYYEQQQEITKALNKFTDTIKEQTSQTSTNTKE